MQRSEAGQEPHPLGVSGRDLDPAVKLPQFQPQGLKAEASIVGHQCRSCRHQATHTAGTILEATKLPLTTWFLAFYQVRPRLAFLPSL
jgi:hypothetical protein